MDRLGVLVAAASLFAFALLAWHIPPFAAAAGLVWLSVLLALVASGHRNAMAVAAGALAALAAGLVTPGSPALFGALILLGALAERTTRVRGLKARLFALGLALGAGAVAASVVAAYAGSGAATATVAVLVAGVLATLPLLVPADDPLAHRLTELAALASEPSRALLTEASHLRRAWNDVGAPRETALRIQPTWEALERLAEARVRLERTRTTGGAGDTTAGAVAPALDQRLREHVDALAKATLAMDAVRAATMTVEDASLAATTQIGDALEAETRALVEVRQDA